MVDSAAQTEVRPPLAWHLQVARWISIVGHPLAMVPASILVIGAHHLPWSKTLAILAVVGAALTVIALYVKAGVRRGQLSDVDLSVRAQRAPTYRVALMLTGGAYLLQCALGFASNGPLGALAVLVPSAVLNHWIKVSLHAAFAVYAAVLVGLFAPGWLALFAPAALAVVWSRLALGRHTFPEVVLGACVGAAGAIVTFVS